MKPATDQELKQIANYIEAYILESFEEQGQIERLEIDEAFQFRQHPHVINVSGEYECKDKDFGEDEIPDYKVKCWLSLVQIHSVETNKTLDIDSNKIESLINN